MNRAFAVLALALLAALWLLGQGRGGSERADAPSPIEAPGLDAVRPAARASNSSPTSVDTGPARPERLPVGEGSGVPPGETLEVRVRDSAGRPPGAPLELSVRDQAAPARFTPPVRLDADGESVYASELEPGAWDVEVLVNGRLVERVAGILVDAAKRARDPRLDPIDLRGRLSSFVLRVERADGSPVKDVRVAAADERRTARHELARSTPKTVWCAGSVDLHVGARGCREALHRAVRADLTVRLGPGLPVALALDDLPVFQGTPEWKLVLRPAAGSAERALDAPLAATGATELLLDAPGTWEVELCYARRGEWLHFEQGAPIGRIEVREEAGRTQRFELRVPRDYFERAER